MVYENVVKYCSSNCISIYEFEKTCHIGNGTVGKWKDSNSNPSISWKSKEHSDDSMFPGYFIVGITTPQGQYTYHYKLEHWDFFRVPELERAPEWDGHTSNDVQRLLSVTTCTQTYDTYVVSKESSLMMFLAGGAQEEALIPMCQVLEYLDGTEEYAAFVAIINTNATDCLLVRAN